MPDPVYWLSPVGENDDFGRPINHQVGGTIYDAKTRHGPWGLMSPESFRLEGLARLGLGYGQRYVKQSDGRWLKKEG